MSIACILGGKGERRTKTRACRDQSPTSIPMDGNATAEAFITHQWLPDSPKTPAPGGTGGTLVGKPLFNETIRYWRFKRGAVGCSWLFHRHRMHSATVARPSWPARLPPKSVKISIRHRQVFNCFGSHLGIGRLDYRIIGTNHDAWKLKCLHRRVEARALNQQPPF